MDLWVHINCAWSACSEIRALSNENKPEIQPVESSEKSEHNSIGSIADLGIGLFDSAVARPYNATLGLALPQIDLSHSYDHHTWAAKAGDFGGSMLDIVALSKVTGWGVGKGLSWGAEGGYISSSLAQSEMLASTLSLGTTGALYGGVFTPGDATTRLKNAAVGSATFAAMGFTTAGLGKFAVLGEAGSRTFLQDVAVGGLSGIPGGLVNAEATSLVNGKGFTLDPYTLGSSALYYGAFGAAMGGTAHGLVKAVEGTQNLLAKSGSSDLDWKLGRIASADKTQPEPEVAGATKAKTFDIPKDGFVDLGKLMRETPAEDQIALVQQVVASRPTVPAGSWMRLIAPEDMVQFLRAIDQMYPKTALANSGHLIDTENLRPPNADSEPINFDAWRQAMATVKAEKQLPVATTASEDGAANAPPNDAAAQKAALLKSISREADKPYSYDEVTMTVRDPEALKQSIAANGNNAMGAKILDFANRWATLMESKIANGEKLTPEMIRQAELEPGIGMQNYEVDLARVVLFDCWKFGPEMRRVFYNELRTQAEANAVNPADLTQPQLQEMENFGSVMLSLANSRSDAIKMVRGIDPANIDPVVQEALLNELNISKLFLAEMGVDAEESIPSVVQAMKSVPQEEIPRFVHYADQFRHSTWDNSVMSAMDQAVARGDVPPPTLQAWIEAVGSKLRRVFPGIKEADWAISKYKSN